MVPTTPNAGGAYAVKPFSVFATRFILAVLAATATVVLVVNMLGHSMASTAPANDDRATLSQAAPEPSEFVQFPGKPYSSPPHPADTIGPMNICALQNAVQLAFVDISPLARSGIRSRNLRAHSHSTVSGRSPVRATPLCRFDYVRDSTGFVALESICEHLRGYVCSP